MCNFFLFWKVYFINTNDIWSLFIIFCSCFFCFFLLLGSEQLGLRRQQKQHKLNIALLFGVTASQRYFTQQINYNFFYLCNIFSIFVDWTPIIQKNKKISHIPKKFSEIFDYTQKIFWNIQILQPHLKLKFFFFYALIIKVVHLPLLQKKPNTNSMYRE